MRNFLKLVALVGAFVPASLLAQANEQRFTRDGATYVYTVQPGRNGRQVIEGRRLPTGSAFRLVVRDGRVDGQSGGQPVSFRVPAGDAVTLAAR